MQTADRARNRNTVHMHIEHIEENADARALAFPQLQFRRRNGFHDHLHHAVRRAHDQAFAYRGDARGIAEEKHAPHGCNQANKRKPIPNQAYNKRHHRENRNKHPPRRVNGHENAFDSLQ